MVYIPADNPLVREGGYNIGERVRRERVRGRKRERGRDQRREGKRENITHTCTHRYMTFNH